MSKSSFFFSRFLGVFLTLGTVFQARVEATDPALTPPVRRSDGTLTVTVTGKAGETVVLQGSPDMRQWSDLRAYLLTGGPAVYEQAPGAQTRHQYFRLKTGGEPIPPNSLSDLSALPNSVFVAGEGFDTVQFAPNGRLGMIFWKGLELTMRERSPAGHWVEQAVSGGGKVYQPNATRTDYKFQPAALLLYDSNSEPHIFKLNGDKTISHFVRSGTAWAESERIQNNVASAGLDLLVGALGPQNTFHLAVVSGGETPNLTYGTKRNGQWSWTSVSAMGAFPRHYLAPSYAPRWFSLAVDSKNAAHLVFRPEHRLSHSGGYVRAYNELAYASNKSGQWSVQIVQKPLDDSGEAGNGLSVAVGPDDKPYIASWYNERGNGGSASASRLFFHAQDASGNWSRTQVISRPDGYIAGDNEKGTGFAPYLRFDAQGRPHILFLDHASEHFGESGQSEYAGHIRHAVLRDGWRWEVETIYRQTDPMRNQMLYPAFAMNGDELVVTGLERATVWTMSPYPPKVVSTYRFRVTSVPLR